MIQFKAHKEYAVFWYFYSIVKYDFCKTFPIPFIRSIFRLYHIFVQHILRSDDIARDFARICFLPYLEGYFCCTRVFAQNLIDTEQATADIVSGQVFIPISKLGDFVLILSNNWPNA